MDTLFISLALLAEVAPTTTGGDTLLTGLVGALGGAGFSVWYGWYVTTKAIPRIVTEHREERKADRDERLKMHETFGAAVKELTNAIHGLPCHQGIPVCQTKPLVQLEGK